MDDRPDRLEQAVEKGLLPQLVARGFRLGRVNSANRGSSVTLQSDDVVIEVVADWLEGELTAEVLLGDRPPLTAFNVTRLPRNVSAAVLQSRLQRHSSSLLAALDGA